MMFTFRGKSFQTYLVIFWKYWFWLKLYFKLRNKWVQFFKSFLTMLLQKTSNFLWKLKTFQKCVEIFFKKSGKVSNSWLLWVLYKKEKINDQQVSVRLDPLPLRIRLTFDAIAGHELVITSVILPWTKISSILSVSAK